MVRLLTVKELLRESPTELLRNHSGMLRNLTPAERALGYVHGHVTRAVTRAVHGVLIPRGVFNPRGVD